MHFDDSVYRRFRGEVYRFAYRHLGDHSASEDIVQDSFVRLAQYGPGSIANTGGMLRKIVRNLIVDRTRSHRHRTEVSLPETIEIAADEPSPERRLLARERVEHVTEALDKMTALRRKVFIMRRLHGMSAKEVAAALSISPAAVDAHVARAVLDLHKAMSARDGQRAA